MGDTSVVMVCRFHTLGTGQLTDQSLRVVDQHGEMLRTNPEFPVQVFKRNQGNLLSRAITGDALRFLRLIGRHVGLSVQHSCY